MLIVFLVLPLLGLAVALLEAWIGRKTRHHPTVEQERQQAAFTRLWEGDV